MEYFFCNVNNRFFLGTWFGGKRAALLISRWNVVFLFVYVRVYKMYLRTVSTTMIIRKVFFDVAFPSRCSFMYEVPLPTLTLFRIL